MLIKPLFGVAFATLALASPRVQSVKDSLYPRSEQDIQVAQDAVAIKGLLTTINEALSRGDQLVQGFTAENAKSQTQKIVSLLKETNPKLESAAQKIKNSKPLGGITSMITLISPGRTLAKTANQTIQHIEANLEVIKNSGQGPALSEGVKAIEPGVKALAKALPGQIPQNLKDTMKNNPQMGGMELKPLTDEQTDQLIDEAFAAITAVLEGKPVPSFTLPAGMTLPSGLLKGKGGAPPKAGGAAPPNEPAPEVTSAPKAPKAPKAAGTLKTSGAPKATSAPKAATPKAAAPKGKTAAPKAPKSTGTSSGSHGSHGHGGMEGMDMRRM